MCHELNDRLNHFIEVEGNLLDFEAARFNFREIENFVQQFQQRFAREFRRLDIFSLLRIERRYQQQVGHADHAVQRSP